MQLPTRLGIARIGVRFAHSNLTSLGQTAGAFSCKRIFELEKSVAEQTDVGEARLRLPIVQQEI